MFSGGPINLRPYLSKAWLDKGGSHGVGLFIGGSLCKLPFMPLGLASTQDRQAANLSLSDLLSPERFFLRCHLVKQQMARAIKIPLLPELFDARMTPWLQSRKRVALEWRNIHKEGRQDAETMAVPSPFTYISAFAATTMGNVRLVFLVRYHTKPE
jgi:hypothetical protein